MGPFGDRVPKWPPAGGRRRHAGRRSSSPRSCRCSPRCPPIVTGGDRAQPGIVLLGAAGLRRRDRRRRVRDRAPHAARHRRPARPARAGRPSPARCCSAPPPPLVLAGVAAAWTLLGDLAGLAGHPARARHPQRHRQGLRPARPRVRRLGPRAAGLRARALRAAGRRRRDPAARLRLPRAVVLEGPDPGRADRLGAVRRAGRAVRRARHRRALDAAGPAGLPPLRRHRLAAAGHRRLGGRRRRRPRRGVRAGARAARRRWPSAARCSPWRSPPCPLLRLGEARRPQLA